jgi:hypothetical protein
MPRVSYHQNVFDLLDLEPRASAAALRQIKACERRCGQPLPASVRDWYMTAGVVPLDGEVEEDEAGYLWHEYSNADHPVPLASVLRAFESADVPGDRAFCLRSSGGRRFVCILIENQAVVSWLVEVDGSDDPPVWVDNDSHLLNDWEQVAPSFSSFLFDWFASYYRRDFTPLSVNSYRVRAGRGPRRPSRTSMACTSGHRGSLPSCRRTSITSSTTWRKGRTWRGPRGRPPTASPARAPGCA